jgi:ubiquitin carboxyl-terminal hydrolase 7
MEDNYGGEYPLSKSGVRALKRFTNAYMLVYIREADLEEIQGDVLNTDIPEHLHRRFDEEQLASEQKRRDKEEQHLYMQVKVLFLIGNFYHPKLTIVSGIDRYPHPRTPWI